MNRFLLLALAAVLFPICGNAQIIINEVMYYPDPHEPEWIELYNAGSETVEVTNWTIREDSNSAGSDYFSATIPAGGYLVVTGNLENFTERWGELPSPVIEASFSYLNNNGGDCVRLRGNSGTEVDMVCYEDEWGGRNGKSLERRSPASPSMEQASWGTSTAPEKGTPGTINSLVASGVQENGTGFNTPDFRIYPVPAIDILSIAFNHERLTERDLTLQVISTDGQSVQTSTMRKKQAQMSVQNIPAGAYLLRVMEGENVVGTESFRIVR